MTNRLATLIMHDARLQLRYGIYFAYPFVILTYILILQFAGPYLPGWAPGLVVFTDPAILGFFFLGALMMLEKAENARTALAVTPISAAEYFWSKTITLTGLALVAVTILTPFIHEDVNWPMLLAIVALTSVQGLGIAIPTAFYFKSVTSYLIGSTGFLVPIIIPGFIALLDPMPIWAILIPTASEFKLILVATGYGTASTLQIIAMFSVTIIATIAAAWFGIKSLSKELGTK